MTMTTPRNRPFAALLPAVVFLLAASAAPLAAQSDEEGAVDVLETFWTAVFESDFDAAAELLHPDEAARLVESLRGNGQELVESLAMLTFGDEIVLADATDEEVLLWFVENQFGVFPLLAEESDESPVELVDWLAVGDEGRAILDINVGTAGEPASTRIVVPTRRHEDEWRILLQADVARSAGLAGADVTPADAGLARETGLVEDLSVALAAQDWTAAASLVHAEHVERAGALARGFVADDMPMALELAFGLDPDTARRMSDLELTAAFIEQHHIAMFRFLSVGGDIVCEGVVSDDDSDVLVYVLAFEGVYEPGTLAVRDDEGVAWILLPLEPWEWMAES